MKFLFCPYSDGCVEEIDCLNCKHFKDAEEDFEQIRESHVVFPVCDE